MEELDTNQIWNDVLGNIKVSVSPAIFSTWLAQTHLVRLDKTGERHTAEVGCISTFVKNTVESRYYGLIQDALTKTVGAPCDILFIIKSPPASHKDQASPLFDQNSSNPDELEEILKNNKIRSYFSFENFAVSASNQMAYAAAEAVSRNPGTTYNPLFIWGGVGVGKTHLMQAVGHHLLRQDQDSKIYFCTSEEFTNDIIEGIRNKTTQSFRDKYRRLKALLIDDIQFIAGKDAVQDEFFHTFNAVTSAGGQIVLTSDKPPSEIARLEERLRSRFEAGLIVDIAAPDFELRAAIVQIKSKQKSLSVDTEMVHLIASNLDSARKIEGFLTRLNSESTLKNIPLSTELITSLIGKGVGDTLAPKQTSPSDVIDAVCKHYSVSRRAIMGKARSRIIARPRQVLMYLLRTELGLPLEEVGRLVGRDHSTVIHGVDKITELRAENVQIREDVLGIKNMF